MALCSETSKSHSYPTFWTSRNFLQKLAVSMFDLFWTTAKSTSSHNRSRSTPQLQDLSSIAKSQWFPAHVTATADSCISRCPPRCLDGDRLAAPCQPHQRNFSPEHGRSTRRELPPLIPPARDQEHHTSHFTPPSPRDSDQFQFSPNQSCQAYPTKASRTLADWFSGESDPITFSILPSPTKEKQHPLELMPALVPSRTSLVQKITPQGTPRPAMSTRFPFFATRAPSPKTPQQPAENIDQLLGLDIHKALFPGGTADPFSPAAFKNLVQNAEGFLVRLQAAYKERTLSLREMTMEKETQIEELEGAETRAKHLKMQLDDMAAKVAEQDEAMMNLVDDLAREKQLRWEEEEARKRSVMLVKASREAHAERSQRESIASMNSDWTCDSGEESSRESIFSHREGATSPTMSMSSVSTANSPEIYHHPDSHTMFPATEATQREIELHIQSIAKATAGLNIQAGTTSGHSSPCMNCQGLKPNEAWNVVGILKEENKALKTRVEQMEGALDGCLDVVEMLR